MSLNVGQNQNNTKKKTHTQCIWMAERTRHEKTRAATTEKSTCVRERKKSATNKRNSSAYICICIGIPVFRTRYEFFHFSVSPSHTIALALKCIRNFWCERIFRMHDENRLFISKHSFFMQWLMMLMLPEIASSKKLTNCFTLSVELFLFLSRIHNSLDIYPVNLKSLFHWKIIYEVNCCTVFSFCLFVRTHFVRYIVLLDSWKCTLQAFTLHST